MNTLYTVVIVMDIMDIIDIQSWSRIRKCEVNLKWPHRESTETLEAHTSRVFLCPYVTGDRSIQNNASRWF